MRDAVDDILDQWARERPDLDRAPMGVVGRIARLARATDDAIRRNFAAFDLLPDEFDVLATLRRAAPVEGMNPRDLLESMMVSSGTMTHRLDKLERRGLIERRPDLADRRGIRVVLTPSGRELVDRAVEAHVALEAELLSGLDAKERDRLADLLRRLGHSVETRGG